MQFLVISHIAGEYIQPLRPISIAYIIAESYSQLLSMGLANIVQNYISIMNLPLATSTDHDRELSNFAKIYTNKVKDIGRNEICGCVLDIN